MSAWHDWMHQPQRTWLRRASFQVHLWTGLALGLYIVVLSLTGSILVYREELTDLFETPRPEYDRTRPLLTAAQLTAAAQRDYPGWTVTRVGSRVTRFNPVIEIWVERGGERRERLFNPYTGADLGDAVPRGVAAVLWVARLHDELLGGERGKFVNGLGSLLLTLLVVTGAVVWWPGVRSWRRAVAVRWRAGWPRLTFDLHSAAGFWFFALIAIWAVSGVYLAIPEPFAAVVDATSDPEAILGERPGDIVLAWVVRLHFGRWQSEGLKFAWALMGIVPAMMFVTGAVMWWNRVLRKRLTARAEQTPAVG